MSNRGESRYILYKHPFQLDTLALVRYCYSLEFDVAPHMCVERNHQITALPSIYDLDQQKWYYGLSQVVEKIPLFEYFETLTGITNLLEKAMEFKQWNFFKKHNPTYRIGDVSQSVRRVFDHK